MARHGRREPQLPSDDDNSDGGEDDDQVTDDEEEAVLLHPDITDAEIIELLTAPVNVDTLSQDTSIGDLFKVSMLLFLLMVNKTY